MTTNSPDEGTRDADRIDDAARDDEDGDGEWPQPLSSEERSRLEAETWNWDAVKVYPGGTGPGVPFPTYAEGAAPPKAGAAPARDPTIDADARDDGAPSSEGIDTVAGEA